MAAVRSSIKNVFSTGDVLLLVILPFQILRVSEHYRWLYLCGLNYSSCKARKVSIDPRLSFQRVVVWDRGLVTFHRGSLSLNPETPPFQIGATLSLFDSIIKKA